MILAYMSLIDSPNDRVNFELAYQTYRNLMFFIAYKILNNPQNAEDAVHTAFIKIAENMSKIEVAVCPKTKAFVVTIVENTAIDLYRKKKQVPVSSNFSSVRYSVLYVPETEMLFTYASVLFSE